MHYISIYIAVYKFLKNRISSRYFELLFYAQFELQNFSWKSCYSDMNSMKKGLQEIQTPK